MSFGAGNLRPCHIPRRCEFFILPPASFSNYHDCEDVTISPLQLYNCVYLSRCFSVHVVGGSRHRIRLFVRCFRRDLPVRESWLLVGHLCIISITCFYVVVFVPPNVSFSGLACRHIPRSTTFRVLYLFLVWLAVTFRVQPRFAYLFLVWLAVTFRVLPPFAYLCQTFKLPRERSPGSASLENGNT